MSEIFGDLHLHSKYSDGSELPENIVKRAKEKGLGVISITDHDTLLGIPFAQKEAKNQGIEVIPGIEISTFKNEVEIHILGYFKSIDKDNALNKIVDKMSFARKGRAEEMVKKLNEHGVDITFDEVLREADIGNISRLHVARVVYNKGGFVRSLEEVFKKYLGFGTPCFVHRDKLVAEDIIKIILDAGGVPVLAHPGLMPNDNYIYDFILAGLKGIEVFYPLHSKKQEEKYKKVAQDKNLLITGGSDCHGKFKKQEFIGRIKLKEIYINKLKESLNY